ncbi:LL-diaminopimelate aminotransferase [bacterium]|nr:LL-diaminopimelate aminotransferase [bacterium]
MSSDPWFQQLFADRIGGINYGKSNAIYKFEKIKRAKRAALAAHPETELLDFGIGENDSMAPASVRKAMEKAINDPANRGYADNGIQAYKDAAARFMKREYGVELDPACEIVHCIGSKPALALLPGMLINPGDVCLMTAPGYPVAGTWTKYFGGEVYNMLLEEKNDYYPDFDAIPEDIVRRAKLMVLNYPNSPTGQLATVEFFKKVIDFARKNQIVVVNDAAHIVLTYGQKPLSFLSIDGAKEVGLETHTMSKGFDMIGWRLGFVCGNPKLVQAYADMKDNTDSGQFKAIQEAAIVGMDDPSIPQNTRIKYERRLKKMVTTLRDLGFDARMPGGTYFLMVKAPRAIEGGQQFENAEAVSQWLIREKMICTVPYDEGQMLRFSATYDVKDGEPGEDGLMQRLKERLKGIKFVF